MPPIWYRPTLALIGPSASLDDVAAARAAKLRKTVALRALTFGALLLACAGAGVWAGIYAAPNASVLAAPLEWRPVAISDNSVTVEVGSGTTSTRLHVPVGGILPNGDQLQATAQARRVFITSTGTTMLRESPSTAGAPTR